MTASDKILEGRTRDARNEIRRSPTSHQPVGDFMAAGVVTSGDSYSYTVQRLDENGDGTSDVYTNVATWPKAVSISDGDEVILIFRNGATQPQILSATGGSGGSGDYLITGYTPHYANGGAG